MSIDEKVKQICKEREHNCYKCEFYTYKDFQWDCLFGLDIAKTGEKEEKSSICTSILNTCNNCFWKEFFNGNETWTCRHCDNTSDSDRKNYFKPSEKAIREDERNKILTLLNSDLETLDLSECDNILLNENSAVANYIKSVKELLEKEK